MKNKVLAILLSIIMLFGITACNNSSTTNNYQQVITCLEANELDKAVNYCAELNEKSLSNGKEAILEVIVKQLNKQLNSSSKWCINNQVGIIDSKVINDFKKYQQILTYIKVSNNDFTNSLTFTNSVISLEKYISWNDFYVAQLGDTYISDGVDYVIEAQNYSGVVAEYYYGLAYNQMNSAYIRYKDSLSSSKGMHQLVNYCYSWVTVLNQWKNGNYVNRDKSYDTAYHLAFDEFQEVTDVVFSTIETWPSKIY